MNTDRAIFMPPAASTSAAGVDDVFTFINIIVLFFFLLVISLMTFFVIKYRRKSETDTTPDLAHNTPLEIVWTVVPLILLIVIFFIGFKSYMDMRLAPHSSMQINVTAKRWMWQFQYPNGVSAINDLVIPAGQPVRLVMNSEDVIHSFYVPDFRVKQDVIPNRYTSLWFQADSPGTHTVFCAEYCGTSHSNMLGKVIVRTPDEFQQWLQNGGIDDISGMPLADQGAILYKAKACNTCHTVDGSVLTGPTWKGAFGKTITTDKGPAVVDENYIHESIVDPMAKVHQGFAPVMPTYKGQITDEQITAIIEYIRSLQ